MTVNEKAPLISMTSQHLISNLASLLGLYWIKRSLLQEIIDVVVVNLNVRDKNTVAAVLIHPICFTSLLWADHVSKLWVNSPTKQEQQINLPFHLSELKKRTLVTLISNGNNLVVGVFGTAV